MFKNVEGRRFAEITARRAPATSERAWGVACADWDRDGDVDLFIEMGGASQAIDTTTFCFKTLARGITG